MVSLRWETIGESADHHEEYGFTSVTERAKVPGGWLVRWFHYARSVKPYKGLERFGRWLNAADAEQPYGYKSGMAFVPDPNYEWDSSDLP